MSVLFPKITVPDFSMNLFLTKLPCAVLILSGKVAFAYWSQQTVIDSTVYCDRTTIC